MESRGRFPGERARAFAPPVDGSTPTRADDGVRPPAARPRSLADVPVHRPDRQPPSELRPRVPANGLPQRLREGMERSFHADFSTVQVRQSREAPDLGARAFARGDEVVFAPGEWRPHSRAGREVLAHELAHVVQQRQGRVRPTSRRGGQPLNDQPYLEREAARSAGDAAAFRPVRRKWGNVPATSPHRVRPVQRLAFKGPQFDVDLAKFSKADYPGHDFANVSPAKAKTACGSQNRIITDGEQVNKAKSNAGTPTDMARYRDGFDRAGGLVRDRTLNQAATKLHLINHRLQNDGVTQGNPNNIMLGTQRANNPRHLHEVENPVIGAVRKYGSRQNTDYENEIGAGVKTKDAATHADNYLFWPEDAVPTSFDTGGVFVLKSNDPAVGVEPVLLPAVPPTKKIKTTDVRGEALKVDANVAALRPAHLWLEYTVTANYPANAGQRLQYVKDNIDHEQNANDAGAKDAAIDQKIQDFKNFWVDNAHPVDFTADVTYYWASYDPWQGIYRTEAENHTIPSDDA
ncbi:MAG TPA: DUF4157 domain-containing protein [Thermoanaerobaculia bacterium]